MNVVLLRISQVVEQVSSLHEFKQHDRQTTACADADQQHDARMAQLPQQIHLNHQIDCKLTYKKHKL